MFILKEQVFIAASDETVYQAVTRLQDYAQWNPWVTHCTNGDAGEGELSEVTVHLGRKTMKVFHKIVEKTPNSRFVWCDTGWFTAFAFGQRERNIRPVEGGVDFEVILSIRGPLTFLTRWLFQKGLTDGLRAETLALKAYCEKNS